MVVAAIAAAAIAGCYKPDIVDGGLRCADGRVCPEGFHCAATGLCAKGPPPVCEAAMPHIDQICEPDVGTDCDPICQSRCDCGRCTLVGAKLTCTAAGDKQHGQACNPDADDCAPGHICRRDCDGLVARCYRFCRNGANTRDVCDGQACDIMLNDPDGLATGVSVCEPPLEDCNPVGAANGCDNPMLGCYVSNSATGRTVCDCKGAGQPGGACGVFSSCIPGYRCITLNGVNTCLKTCTIGSATDCSPNLCMSAGGGMYGFCPP